MTRNKWDVPIDLDLLWDQYHRILKENGAVVLHCMQPFTTKLIMSNLKEFKYCYVWDKHSVSGFLNANRRPLVRHEDIAVFYRKQPVFNPQKKKGAMKRKGSGGALLRRIIVHSNVRL